MLPSAHNDVDSSVSHRSRNSNTCLSRSSLRRMLPITSVPRTDPIRQGVLEGMEQALEAWAEMPDGTPDGHSLCRVIESFPEEIK